MREFSGRGVKETAAAQVSRFVVKGDPGFKRRGGEVMVCCRCGERGHSTWRPVTLGMQNRG